MRTSSSSRKSGVATILLAHALNAVIDKGYQKVRLETGTQHFFRPARNLYEKFGFTYCEPFADYKLDANSTGLGGNVRITKDYGINSNLYHDVYST